MKPFILKYESISQNFSSTMIETGRYATLQEAINAQKCNEHKPFIHHEPTDLELRDVGNRMAWLDLHGQERSAP